MNLFDRFFDWCCGIPRQERTPPDFRMSRNPSISSKVRAVHLKIEEEKPEKRPTTPLQRALGILNCPECYGYGLLLLTEKNGAHELYTCDFCGNEEPIGDMLTKEERVKLRKEHVEVARSREIPETHCRTCYMHKELEGCVCGG